MPLNNVSKFYYVYTISDRFRNGMEIILDRFSVYTAIQICVLTFISDSNHNATISKVKHYLSGRFS